MTRSKTSSMLFSTAVLAMGLGLAYGSELESRGRLSVAVTEPEVGTIVTAVGGDQVDSFSLLKGCILRRNLQVESDVMDRLARADAVVWSGFLRESAAVNDALRQAQTGREKGVIPAWIDISKGAARVDIPVTTCYGDNDFELVSGDPFFWLNPQNGSVIARNLAEGLGDLRPEKRGYFMSNADAFARTLDSDIDRWKKQLSALAGLRVFATLCGWQNFSRLGGPRFIVCKETPGSLPTPRRLLEQLRRMEADVVIVDPNTSYEYVRAFREEHGLTVIEVPSSIGEIPGARTYSALFDNMIQALLKNAKGGEKRGQLPRPD